MTIKIYEMFINRYFINYNTNKKQKQYLDSLRRSNRNENNKNNGNVLLLNIYIMGNIYYNNCFVLLGRLAEITLD